MRWQILPPTRLRKALLANGCRRSNQQSRESTRCGWPAARRSGDERLLGSRAGQRAIACCQSLNREEAPAGEGPQTYLRHGCEASSHAPADRHIDFRERRGSGQPAAGPAATCATAPAAAKRSSPARETLSTSVS
jgi:hypothetical protein